MDFLKDKINLTVRQLDRFRREWSGGVDGFLYRECPPKKNNELPRPDDAGWSVFTGESWNLGRDSHAWFYKHLTVPSEASGKPVRLEVRTGTRGWNVNNPQFIVYVNGELRQGLDVNHTSVLLGTGAEYDIWLYAYTGALAQDLKFCPSLYVTDPLCEKVYYDLRVPFDLLDCLNPLSKEHADILEYLDRAANKLDFRHAPDDRFRASLAAAEAYLESEFYGKYCHTQETSVICIGHTHIDCAWKWTFAQSREKVQRSFSNVLTNMETYPEYKFMQSQPLLYQFTKEEAPELYEKIRQKVKEKRWEPEGAMWVEADCNLPAGESFVRQFLYGKKFFREEFGTESRLLWLPDVFGYSGALPQILKKSGVDYFITSKLSWNEKNRYPYDIFRWRGIDGTEVNSYFLTAQNMVPGRTWVENRTDYNAHLTPKYVMGTAERLQQKHLTSEVLMPFGFGDGGGGPVREDMEVQRRLARGIRSCPSTSFGFMGEFMDRLFAANEGNDHLPVWEGELYFELHRGTLTSIAKNKRNNRLSEFLYQNIEQLAVLNKRLLGTGYPKEQLDRAWITILSNQFHDVIPGSSIDEVYRVSDAEYANLLGEGGRLESALLRELAKNVATEGGVLVYNPHSVLREGDVRVDGELIHVKDIPSKGWCVVKPAPRKGTVKTSGRVMENDFFRLEFNDAYILSRIYDKKNSREVLKPGRLGNRLVVYEDYPKNYDAWEISEYYTEKHWELDDVSGAEFVSDGVRTGLKLTRSYCESVLTQTVWLYEDTPRIDFETDADWHEDHVLLRVLFDTDIHAARATYNIQFGNIERSTLKNTSWDTARFEVCGHKFADLSEGNYGVALMNDCKYGYSAHDGVLGLSLIKCAKDPNPHADMGAHHFTYSLFPHAGGLEGSGTVALAYELNQPMTAIRVPAQSGKLPDRFSLVSSDQPNVIVETVKNAEADDGTVFRLYECENSRTPCTLSFGIPFEKAVLCDLQENELEPLDAKDGKLSLVIKPFEIVTVKVK